MKIGAVTVLISHCTTGVYLRWWFNGWHYFLFTNGYEITMQTESMDTQVTNMFSVISKIEHPTKLKADYAYRISLDGITAANIPGFTGLLLAEKVEQYQIGTHSILGWYEVEITRGAHITREDYSPGYTLTFEITRKELPNTPAVFQKSIKLYLDTTLCDMDEDEVVPVNKQTNDIAEMADRQSDFTNQFKIRKTRAMRALFELSGEVGANTTLPYENQSCRLVQDNIEMITNGILILDRVDDSYYYVSVYSGNLNFFKELGVLKIGDLDLDTAPSDCQHDWTLVDMAASHAGSLNYVYPLCEPSEDGSLVQKDPGVETVNLYGGWVWPFIKVKAIWDEIILNSGYLATGEILEAGTLLNDTFEKLFMPIASLKVNKEQSNNFLYSVWWTGYHAATAGDTLAFTGATLILGDNFFRIGFYQVPFAAKYKIHIQIGIFYAGISPVLELRNAGVLLGTFDVVHIDPIGILDYEIQTGIIAMGDFLEWRTDTQLYYSYSIQVVDITEAKIGFSNAINPKFFLPDITQVDFIKMVCNMFGLIPEAIPRDRTIRFWNYLELYDNIPIARNWSAYLSEREDETEFKFGDYAQNNYMRYKDSDDVIQDEGRGNMQIADETLALEKDVFTVPISTCEEIFLDPMMAGVPTSRIAFNTYDADKDLYVNKDSIDPRIVYIKALADTTPPIKTLQFRDNVTFGAGASVDIANPKKATSTEVAFSSLVANYAGLSRMLTKTNLRRAKFNLPVYEVAGLKHYIPIYLSQYKAYFYVNKINNYIPGNLCIIDLIKL